MALDNIYHRHGIMPGAVRSSPAFDNASKALQRLTLDNEAAAAVATGDWQCMEQVLEVARAHNNPVVVRRLEVRFLLSQHTALRPQNLLKTYVAWSRHDMGTLLLSLRHTPLW